MESKPTRFFLDANVLFSAAHRPEGRCAGLLELAGRKRCALLTSPYAVEETRRNIREKSPAALGRLDHLLQSVRMTEEAPSDLVREAVVRHGVPASDGPILAAALKSGAGYLVTGDRNHFGRLMDRRISDLAVQVLSPASALRLLLVG